MGFHPAKFGLSRPFHSWVMLRHGTDKRTDRQTDTTAHFIMPPSLWGRRHDKFLLKLGCISIYWLFHAEPFIFNHNKSKYHEFYCLSIFQNIFFLFTTSAYTVIAEKNMDSNSTIHENGVIHTQHVNSSHSVCFNCLYWIVQIMEGWRRCR